MANDVVNIIIELDDDDDYKYKIYNNSLFNAFEEYVKSTLDEAAKALSRKHYLSQEQTITPVMQKLNIVVSLRERLVLSQFEDMIALKNAINQRDIELINWLFRYADWPAIKSIEVEAMDEQA